MSSAPTTIEFTPTCDLYDKYLEQARIPTLQWRSFGKRKQFCGQVVTIECPSDDNSRVKEQLEQQSGRGLVLIVNTVGGLSEGASKHDCAMLGDMIAKVAVKNEWEGVIVNGNVRDVDELAQVDLGIFALGCTPRKSTRRGEGVVSVPITIGGVCIQPLDWVFADNDGVLVLDSSTYEFRS
jgi:regulator of ribonuclease activity A